MLKKIVDLKQFVSKEQEDPTIRKIFYNDNDLKIIYCILNNEQPISLPNLTRQYNAVFMKIYTKQWIDSKLKKLEQFHLFEKKGVSECEFKSKEDKIIIEKHKKWLIERNIPPTLYKTYDKMIYYYLTEKGEKWIDFIQEVLGRKER